MIPESLPQIVTEAVTYLEKRDRALFDEELLRPISISSPSGENLRYDTLFDRIVDARSEDDVTLPQGQWERQTKKPDFALTAGLAHEALAHQSKDLWLAAWLGDAQMRLLGVAALRPAVALLLALQQEFWETLHPEIEEGDSSMRAAPVEWAMQRFAALVHAIPSLTPAHSYLDYQRTRAPRSETELEAAVAMNALLDETGKSHFAVLDRELADLSETIETLFSFCERRYGEDGPSFSGLRGAVAELHNVVASLLREKRRFDPEPSLEASAEDTRTPVVEDTRVEDVSSAPIAAPVFMPSDLRRDEGNLRSEIEAEPSELRGDPYAEDRELPNKEVAGRGAQVGVSIASVDEAVNVIRQGALYLARHQPLGVAAYLLLCALSRDQQSECLLEHPPSSTMRAALRRAKEGNDWNAVLTLAFDAMSHPGGADWLDLHRYVWLAASAHGQHALAGAVEEWVHAALAREPLAGKQFFEDDTPVANEATRDWLDAVTLPRGDTDAREQPDLAAGIDRLSGNAVKLAVEGDLVSSVKKLMEDASTSPARRLSFVRRLQVAQLCTVGGQRDVALRLLQQLLSETEMHQLALWEGPALVGEVLGLLLECLDAAPEAETAVGIDRKSLLARLFELDPVRALGLVVRAQEVGSNGTH